MWKLTIEDDQGNRIPVPLVRDDYSIGRGPENTLRLTERNVSRQHASLRREDGRWTLVDRDSYNGSYINGQRVPGEQELSDGDLIQLGDYRIEVLEDAAAVALVREAPHVDEEAPAPLVQGNGLAIEEATASDDFDAMAEAMGPAAAWPHEMPSARKAGGKKTGVLVGAVAALAIGGAVFAFSGSKSMPEPTVAAATAPSPQPVERAPEPAPVAEAAEEPVAEPVVEVAQAIDLDETPPKQEEAPAPSPRETSPQPTSQVRVASAPAPAQEKPRTTPAATPAPAPAAPRPTATTERRPVLAANPFDDPAPTTKTTTKSAKPPSQPSSAKGGSSFAELAAQGREGEAKMRPILEQRVARGTASEADIRLLRAICRNMGDRVCADRMSALLAKKN